MIVPGHRLVRDRPRPEFATVHTRPRELPQRYDNISVLPCFHAFFGYLRKDNHGQDRSGPHRLTELGGMR